MVETGGRLVVKGSRREVEVSPTLRENVVIHDLYSLASNSCCPAVVAEDAAFDEAPKLRPQTERSRFVCFEMSFVKWIFLREGMLGFKQKKHHVPFM